MDFWCDFAVARTSAFHGEVAQKGIFTPFSAIACIFCMDKLGRYVKVGQEYVPSEGKVLHLVTDFLEGIEQMRYVCKALSHFRPCRQVELIVRESVAEATATANGRGFFLVLLNAEQDVMGLRFLAVQIVGIVRGDGLNPVLRAEAQQGLVDDVFFRQAVTVDFRVEILAKLLLVPKEGLFGLFFTDVEQQLRHFAIQSAGGAHHPFGVRS